VITSIIELVAEAIATESSEGGGGFITVLRAGRLFRIFKLARAWEALQKVIVTVTRSFNKILPLSIILLLFMFIFSLLGMQLYGGGFMFVGRGPECYSWEDVENGCSIPRANFDNFGVAMVTIFQMMTGEDWNMVMYDGIAATGGGSFLYFAIIVVIGNFLILNLFLTILLSGFEDEEEDPEVEKAAKRDELYTIFKSLDKDHSGTVSKAELQDEIVKKRLKTEEELTELFGEKSEIVFNEFISFFPEFAEAEDEAEEPGFLRKLLCCLKTTQEPPSATEDLGIVGPGGPLVDDESSIPPHKAFFFLGPTNCLRAGAFKFIGLRERRALLHHPLVARARLPEPDRARRTPREGHLRGHPRDCRLRLPRHLHGRDDDEAHRPRRRRPRACLLERSLERHGWLHRHHGVRRDHRERPTPAQAAACDPHNARAAAVARAQDVPGHEDCRQLPAQEHPAHVPDRHGLLPVLLRLRNPRCE
jgi:hypothetical protein